MKIYRWCYRLTLIVMILLGGITLKSNASTLPDNQSNSVEIPGTGRVDDSNIHFIGRWDSADFPWITRGYWPGVYLRVSFTGTTNIGVQLGGAVSFYAQIDNGQYVFFPDANGNVTLASGLAPATIHVLKIAARGEYDILRFQRLIMDAGGLTVASPVKNIVEFVGDSTTLGRGSSLDAVTAYPRITADSLGAEYVNISFTGVCLVDGFRCGWYTGMSRAFFRLQTVPHSTSTEWDFSRYQPKAVVINLGTNDTHYGITDTQFQSSYISFLENIRAKYPNAIILAMRTFNGSKVPQTWAAVNARRVAGDTNVHFIDNTNWLTSTDYADPYHLNDSGNAKVGHQLAAIIRSYLFNDQPTPTQTATTAPLPTNTPQPTVIIPTNTPIPTNTVIPPTNTPAPTNTAIPTNTATNVPATTTRQPTVVVPTNTPAPPTAQPTRHKKHPKLKLSPLCSPSPNTYRVWRVENKGDDLVNFTWVVLGTKQKGTGAVPADQSIPLITITQKHSLNILVIFVDGRIQEIAVSRADKCR